jgi:hypothetical protein
MTWYTNWWADNYPPTKSADGYDVFLGSAGRGNIFLRLYLYSNKNKTLLNIASAYVDHAISILPRNQAYGSFMFGHVGVWTLKAVIEEINGNNAQVNEYLGYIQSSFASVDAAIKSGASRASNGIDMSKCGLDEGLTGMLYAGLLVNKQFNKEVIAVSIISDMVFYIMDFGIASGAKLHTDFMQYECPFIRDCYLWGPGHGSSGVIYTVYTAYNEYPQQLAALFTNPKYYNALKNTMDFFVSIQLEDGNIPTDVQGTCAGDYGTDPDARVQWCHGAPGFQSIFVLSAIHFSSRNMTSAEAYLNSGLRCANTTWDRGLLVKGTMYCHGIGGNTNMLWETGKLLVDLQSSGDPAFLQKLAADGYDLAFLMNQSVWRAKQFVLWTLNWSNIYKTRLTDSNEGYSMYQGNYALPMLYIQTLQDGWPFKEPVCHPGWNLCV